MAKFFHTDGSKAGFYTAVFDAYSHKDAYVTDDNRVQFGLFDEWTEVFTDRTKAEKVEAKLRKIDRRALVELDRILRSPHTDRAQIAFLYVKLIVRYGKAAREKLTLPEVRKATQYCTQVSFEIHRLHGFLRFRECENGVFYADCSPDNDLVDLLFPHFRARFKTQPFVIHDVKRGKAILYDGSKEICVPVGEADVRISEKEEDVSALWRRYYSSVAIPARKNARQMKQYMPTRYWAFITEKQGDLE